MSSNESLIGVVCDQEETIKELEEKLLIAINALKEYGNISAWIYDNRPGFLGEANGGSIAREALRKLGAI